ncbi:hypothetical protein GGR93_002703 [Sulfitobacter noctilucicola]|uniref:Uncharacterized protein n=1 Tax=Sulfitobacter noctilucicola TaxID=1342301 RepID=A0A7W6M9I2_9RHOB|nr:hypothetical protein [Sulfitobacter noctilucicola]
MGKCVEKWRRNVIAFRGAALKGRCDNRILAVATISTLRAQAARNQKVGRGSLPPLDRVQHIAHLALGSPTGTAETRPSLQVQIRLGDLLKADARSYKPIFRACAATVGN